MPVNNNFTTFKSNFICAINPFLLRLISFASFLICVVISIYCSDSDSGESNLNEFGPTYQMLGRSVLHLELGGRAAQLLHVAVVVVLQVALLLFLFVGELVFVAEEPIGESQIRDLVLILYYFVRFF